MTATSVPNAMQQFVDANGAPLASGSVYFYVPGTTVAKTTWQDAAQTVPNPNPVLLDSAGRALIYGSGTYRQIVKDALGNTIWDQPTTAIGTVNAATTVLFNIAALRAASFSSAPSLIQLQQSWQPEDDGGTWYYDPADTTTADNGGTIIVGADGKRWKRLGFSPNEIDARWFDIANSNPLTAVQNAQAINTTLGSVNSSARTVPYTVKCRGQSLNWSAGVWLLQQAYVTWDFDGTTITCAGGSGDLLAIDPVTNVNNIQFSRIRGNVVLNGNNIANHGLRLRTAPYFSQLAGTMEIKNCLSDGFRAEGCVCPYTEDLYTHNNAGWGAVFDSTVSSAGNAVFQCQDGSGNIKAQTNTAGGVLCWETVAMVFDSINAQANSGLGFENRSSLDTEITSLYTEVNAGSAAGLLGIVDVANTVQAHNLGVVQGTTAQSPDNFAIYGGFCGGQTVGTSGAVAAATLTAGGSGGTDGTYNLIFTATGGDTPSSTATGTFKVVSGVVREVRITGAGAGYNHVPTLGFSNCPGLSGASATAQVGNAIRPYNVAVDGGNYFSIPACTFGGRIRLGASTTSPTLGVDVIVTQSGDVEDLAQYTRSLFRIPGVIDTEYERSGYDLRWSRYFGPSYVDEISSVGLRKGMLRSLSNSSTHRANFVSGPVAVSGSATTASFSLTGEPNNSALLVPVIQVSVGTPAAGSQLGWVSAQTFSGSTISVTVTLYAAPGTSNTVNVYLVEFGL